MNGQPQGRNARLITLLTTNLIKLGGLVTALNELLLRPALRPVALAVIAFMMAGAQLSEGLILTVIDRLIGASAPPAKPVPAEKETST